MSAPFGLGDGTGRAPRWWSIGMDATLGRLWPREWNDALWWRWR